MSELGKVSVPGDIPVTVIFHVIQFVTRHEVYAVLSIPPLPSPKRAIIISPVVGLVSQNAVLRKSP